MFTLFLYRPLGFTSLGMKAGVQGCQYSKYHGNTLFYRFFCCVSVPAQ